MFATTMALISNTYTGRERGMAFGIWGAVNGAASAVGPIIGGLLTANFGWRWIFLVNLPVSVVAVALTLRVVGRVQATRNPRRIDLPGMASFTVAAAALTYALIRGDVGVAETHRPDRRRRRRPRRRSSSPSAAAPAPMLDLELLRNRTFTAMLLAGALLSAAAWAAMTYQSLWLQSVLGLSAIKAGLVVLPCAAAAFIVSGQVGRFLHRTSPRWMVGTGLLVIAVGALAQAVLREDSSWPVVIPGLVLVGIGAGLAMASLTSTAMSAVPWQQAGMAGGALSAFRQLGYAFGIAVLGEVFDSGLTHGAGPGLSAALQRRPGPGGAGPDARRSPRSCTGRSPTASTSPTSSPAASACSPRSWCSPWSARARRRARQAPQASRGRPSPPRRRSRRRERVIPNGGGVPMAARSRPRRERRSRSAEASGAGRPSLSAESQTPTRSP